MGALNGENAVLTLDDLHIDFSERRNVFKVGIAYLVVAWLVAQNSHTSARIRGSYKAIANVR